MPGCSRVGRVWVHVQLYTAESCARRSGGRVGAHVHFAYKALNNNIMELHDKSTAEYGNFAEFPYFEVLYMQSVHSTVFTAI